MTTVPQHTLGELRDGLAHVLEAAHHVGQRRGGPEVLLLKTELLTDCNIVNVGCLG